MDIKDFTQLTLMVGSGIYILIGLITYIHGKKKKDSKIKFKARTMLHIGCMFYLMSDIIANDPVYPETINWIAFCFVFVMLTSDMIDYGIGDTIRDKFK